MNTPPPSTPPTMTVRVAVGFVAGCAECLAAVEIISRAALRDRTVTGFTAIPGKKHAHDVTEAQQTLPRPAGEISSAGSSEISPTRSALAISVDPETGLPWSDTNGSLEADPMMFCEAEMEALHATQPTHYEREVA